MLKYFLHYQILIYTSINGFRVKKYALISTFIFEKKYFKIAKYRVKKLIEIFAQF